VSLREVLWLKDDEAISPDRVCYIGSLWDCHACVL
jgi:hypothetical protein